MDNTNIIYVYTRKHAIEDDCQKDAKSQFGGFGVIKLMIEACQIKC